MVAINAIPKTEKDMDDKSQVVRMEDWECILILGENVN